MIGLRLLRTIIARQLMSTEKPEDDFIECVCRLLLTIGASCDATLSGQKMLDQIESRLCELGQGTGKRLLFLISDVSEARQRGWTKKPPLARNKRTDLPQQEDGGGGGASSMPVSASSSLGYMGKPSYLLDPDTPYSRYVISQLNYQENSEESLPPSVGAAESSLYSAPTSATRVTFPEPIFRVRPYNPQEPVRPCTEGGRRSSVDSSSLPPSEFPSSGDGAPSDSGGAACLSPCVDKSSSVRFSSSEYAGGNRAGVFVRRPPTPMRGPAVEFEDSD
eukprot:Gregarina_sp_Pseudo_9__5266@NODE_601_length_2518_cov_4_048810_g567_i0_p1_GENE_NODE_601_length_2518_cov_4_048810_g567_i0NODE_601_length_2518_cov_4_048810_g567_i0_p1_ORF_typecomplete_len277_score49_91MIF4G/PF02854_19/2_9e06_NODE_601_length_2518_cov_4_048810_g567_i08921722